MKTKKTDDRFAILSKKERSLIVRGLISVCQEYVDYGLYGYNIEGRKEYNSAVTLLLELDKKEIGKWHFADVSKKNCG